MKAAVFYDKNNIRYEERPMPTIGEGEVLLRMEVCGLCGTDIHKVLDETVPETTVLGHEVAGTIVEIGQGVEEFVVGDRVFVAHHVPCFTCHYCQRKLFTLCKQFKETNLEPGGFSEYIRVPALHVKHTMGKLPENVTFEEGALVEPVACCLHGFESMDIRPGDSVLILGAGQIGCLQIQIARHLLAGQIFVSDINPYRLEQSLHFGATAVMNSKTENLQEKVMEWTAGQGVDHVIISAGVSALLTEAMNCVRKGGTILVFAPFREEEIAIPAHRFFMDELKVIGSYSSHPYNYETALQLIQQGVIRVNDMVTHRFPLAQLDEAIHCAHSPNEQALKVLLVP
ncbi:zinc-dependent dehydrogenase [Lysinibacillus piscis]|uniref:Alcohol dehydrogenase n=1 Tax=Lysinibacillus piscis TaxID=2518931 RepID=A0ABQ5NFX4_9BACI|nr:zinc-dependent dehydrogenase [Lysinibacillus sp. KH24]GLC87149.1 alcohol dehydrogenase [Lysinibacillus sp. KH24]